MIHLFPYQTLLQILNSDLHWIRQEYGWVGDECAQGSCLVIVVINILCIEMNHISLWVQSRYVIGNSG